MPSPSAATPPSAGPITEYVLKVASRCNLACDHCYIYADPARGWLDRPVMMDSTTARVAASRIAEHAARHGQHRVAITLHGGEPLLVNNIVLGEILAVLRKVVSPIADLDLHLQSNGVLLTREVCELLAEHDVKVGVSLDGDQPANDRHRRLADGRGSHQYVLSGLQLLRTPPYRAIYSGILCTIDVQNDPIRVYEALLREDPPQIDFLLPHATWDRPPPRPAGKPNPYADWLLTIYDRWLAGGRAVPVRIFNAVHSLQRGRRSRTEALGSDHAAVVVIETNGRWELVDSLKVVAADAPHTGLDVRRHSVDDLLLRLDAAAAQTEQLSPICRRCPIVEICGGGLLAHRFGRGNGFDNPSVYCTDLLQLIVGIRDRSQRHHRPTVAASAPDSPATTKIVSPLPDAAIRDLAAGHPTDATLAYLAKSEYARDRKLIATVCTEARDGVGRSALELLHELDRQSTRSVETVLRYPFVRARARRSLNSRVPDGRESPSGLLASVAAAAAVQANSDVSIEVPLWEGMLALPGLGTMSLPDARSAVVNSRPGEIVVYPDHGPAREVPATGSMVDGWREVRTVPIPKAQILFDDADPGRDCFEHPVLAIRRADRAGEWERSLVRAWAAVRADVPHLARGLDVLVKAITPIRPRPHRPPRVGSTPNAFGAIALSLGAPQALGALLVSASARLTLTAVLSVCEIAHPDGQANPAELVSATTRGAVLEYATAALQSGGRAAPGITPPAERAKLLRALDRLDNQRGWAMPGLLLLDGLRERIERCRIDG